MTNLPVYHVAIKYDSDTTTAYFPHRDFSEAVRCYVSNLMLLVYDEQHPGTFQHQVVSVELFRTTPERFLERLFHTEHKEA